jgi:hypothetical protein
VATTAISAAVKTTLADDPQPPPAPPPTPSIAGLSDPNNLGTIVADAGALYGDDMSNRYRSSGIAAQGTFSGTTINAIPEPGSLVGIATMLASALTIRTRSHRGTRFPNRSGLK